MQIWNNEILLKIDELRHFELRYVVDRPLQRGKKPFRIYQI